MPVIACDPKEPRAFTVTEAAYIAGIIDGEGCISLRRRTKVRKDGSPTVGAIMEVSNTCLDLLAWLQKTTGCGAVYSFGMRQSGQKQAYRIGWNQEQMRWILPQIQPFLVVKAEQGRIVLDHLVRKDGWEKALERKEAVNGLNVRGTSEEVVCENENGTCPVCDGVVDRSKYARKTYCSEKCQQDAYNAGRPKGGNPVEERACAHCGQAFETTRPEARYCSGTCRGAAHVVRKRKGEGMKPRDIELTCNQCSQVFKSARPDAKYCSHRCRIAGWRAEKKAA